MMTVFLGESEIKSRFGVIFPGFESSLLLICCVILSRKTVFELSFLSRKMEMRIIPTSVHSTEDYMG